jgi:hypothetical protein
MWNVLFYCRHISIKTTFSHFVPACLVSKSSSFLRLPPPAAVGPQFLPFMGRRLRTSCFRTTSCRLTPRFRSAMDDLEQAISLASDSSTVVATAPVVHVEPLAFCSRDESPLSSLLRICLPVLASSPCDIPALKKDG